MSDKLLKEKETYKDFEVLKVFELKDYHSTALHIRHKKTGMEVLHLVNDETENLFAFAFRTLNKKGNGAAHIMEHSVLCGSEKFPLKDPFTQLSNQSVKTYLNAATYPDKTVYPASSTIEADYFNLMNVYSDAVFFPKLSEEIFSQEAHRLEIDKDGNPSIQGVVYNEMKGAYSSFEGVAMDIPVQNLLKGTIYAKDSGGNPAEIPTLTYDEYIAFHEKWYRPENCLVFLYGNIDTKKQLDFLQENILSRIEKKHPDYCWNQTVELQIKEEVQNSLVSQDENFKPFVKAYGPAGESQEKDNTVLVTWNLGHSKNACEAMEKLFVTGILLNHDGSPLTKGLVDSQLGEDTAPGTGLSSLYSTLFTAGLRGVKDKNVKKVEELVFDIFSKIVEKGIDKNDVASTLMTLEFSYREIRRANGPFALALMNSPINAWLYGEKIEESFKTRDILEKIRGRIENEEGYLESLVKKFFLDNKNYCVSQIKPSKKYNEDFEAEEKKIIENLMSRTTVEEIKIQNDKLHVFQTQKDDTSCLPHLKPSQFLQEGKRISDSISAKVNSIEGFGNDNVDFIESAENTNGITYLNVGFPADVLKPEDYALLPAFTEAVCDCGWGSLDWSKAAEETALHTGGIICTLLVNDTPATENNKSFVEQHEFCGREWVIFKLRVIDEKLKDGLRLFADNINLVDFHDTKRLKDILVEVRNDFDSGIVPSGHQYAILRALRKTSRICAIDELWNGISLMYNLHKCAERKQSENAKDFNRIFAELKKGGGFIHITAEPETIEKSKKMISDFARNIGLTRLKKASPSPAEDFIALTDLEGPLTENQQEVIEIPAQVGFASESFAGFNEFKKNSIVEVCNHWLSNILLWEKVRTIGGAYGVFCDSDSVSGQIMFATYRDPTPEKSNDVFEQCLKEASEMTFTEDEVEKAVIGTYSRFVIPKTPRAKGSIGLIRALYGIDEKDREEKLINLLNCNSKILKETFQKLYEFSKGLKYRVIIGPHNDSVVGKKITLPL